MRQQGWLILAIIIAGSAPFVATRGDWASMLISALALPLIMVALVHGLSRFPWTGPRRHGRSRGPGQADSLIAAGIAAAHPSCDAQELTIGYSRYSLLIRVSPAMTPYFFTNPVIRVLFVGTVALWMLLELRQALKRRTEARNADRGSRLVLSICWTGAILVGALSRANVPAAALPAGPVTVGVGIVMTWTGIGLRLWSFRSLGRYFTLQVMISADQPVITTGPYRLVRHPSYAGLLLIFAGIGVLLANWLSLGALILLPLAGLTYRIRVEEAALSTTLGDVYTSYAAGRKRVIPFVW